VARATAASPEVLPFVLPLVKVDRRTGEFVAKAALEIPDGSRELCDYASSRPFFEQLEQRCLVESNGKKVAPLREMHGLIAAGNVTRFDYNDDAREVTCFGKITDPSSLTKVVEGTLCGVSMGGLKRYLGYDAQHPGVRRYTAMPKEISLVDLGDIPGTGLTMLNAAGGTIEVVDGEATEQRAIPGLAEALRKVAGSLEEYQRAADAAVRERYGVEANGCAKAWVRETFEAAVIVCADGKLIRHATLRNADGTVTLGQGIPVAVTYVPLPDGIDGTFGDALRTVGEVLAEMAAGDESEAAMANATDALRSMKKRVQRMHDCSVEMGAACAAPMEHAISAAPAAEEDTMDPKELAKAVRAELGLEGDQPLAKAIGGAVEMALGLKTGSVEPDGVLAKAVGAAVTASLGLTAEGAAADGLLAKAIGGAVKPLSDEIAAIKDKVDKIAAQPAEPKGALLALTKAADGGASDALAQQALRELGKSDPAALARILAGQPGNAWHMDTTGASPLVRS